MTIKETATMSRNRLVKTSRAGRGAPTSGRLRGLLLARITLAFSDHYAARDYLQAAPRDDLTPRRTLWHQILLAAAIERGNPGVLAGVLGAARRGGFCPLRDPSGAALQGMEVNSIR